MLITTLLAIVFSFGGAIQGSNATFTGWNMDSNTRTSQPVSLMQSSDYPSLSGTKPSNYIEYVTSDSMYLNSAPNQSPDHFEEITELNNTYWDYYGVIDTGDATDGFVFHYEINQDYAVGLENYNALYEQFTGYVTREFYTLNNREYSRYYFVYGYKANRIYVNSEFTFNFTMVNVNDNSLVINRTVNINLCAPNYEFNPPIVDSGFWQGYRVYRALICDLPTISIIDDYYEAIYFHIQYHVLDFGAIRDYYGDTSYELGFESGYTQGYDSGYIIGINNGSSVEALSFRQLIGTIIDAPVLYLRKMFGYDVFGVNIYGALATLISLLLALAIFRLVRSII